MLLHAPQVTRPDAKIGVNAVDRTLEDWLLRCDEATAELALEMKRNHTHHVHSILGGKGVLTDKEIIAPEDELASQVSCCQIWTCLVLSLKDRRTTSCITCGCSCTWVAMHAGSGACTRALTWFEKEEPASGVNSCWDGWSNALMIIRFCCAVWWAQVNDTELLPALSTAFSEAEASGGHVGSFSTIFDDQKLNEEGQQQQPSSEGDAQAPFEAKGGGKGSSSDDQGVSAQDKAALEGDAAAAASPKGEENSNSNRAGGMRGMRAAAAGGHQHASGGGGELPGSQVWHAVYSLWRGG